MKKGLGAFFLSGLVISLCFGCGGGGGGGTGDANTGGGNTGYGSLCEGEDLYGPEGGAIEVTDTNSPFYEVRVVIPPGAVDDCRSFHIEEGFAASLPVGSAAYLNNSAQFDLSTGGDKPYDMELELQFPVQGMAVQTGQLACAFGYDERSGKWNIIMPDSIDENKMTVRTTYRDTWMWGKIDLNHIADEYVIGAAKERYGEEVWGGCIDSIAEAIEELKALYFDNQCTTWEKVRDDLTTLIALERNRLSSYYQPKLDACGGCDLFAADFGIELSEYLLARIAIITVDVINAWLDSPAGTVLTGMPFLDDISDGLMVEKLIAVRFIESQQCQYSCVTEQCGVGVYADYAVYITYGVTQLMVTLAIEDPQFSTFIHCTQ